MLSSSRYNAVSTLSTKNPYKTTTMIRLPPSRILPGQNDIHHHLERVFARVAARYDNIALDSEDDADDEEEEDDDYGYDLASIPESDLSFAPSTFPADEGCSESGSVECHQPNGGNVRYNANVVSPGDEDPGDDDQQYSSQDQGHASFETAPESLSVHGVDDGEVMSSAGMSSTEMARAQHSLRQNHISNCLSIGNLMALGMYPWPNYALLPIHRVNPRVLMTVPEDDTWPQTDVSSLGSLFNSLSLNTLPDNSCQDQSGRYISNHTGLNEHSAENQKPSVSQTKKDQSPFNLDKGPSFTKTDIQPNEMPGSIQDDNMPQTDLLMNNTPLSQNAIFEPNDTEPDTENESNSARSTMASHNKGRGRKSSNARGGRRNGNNQTPAQNDTPVDSKKSSRGGRSANGRQTSRSTSRSSVVGTDNQASNAPQDQTAAPQAAPTQNHPMNSTTNSRLTNGQAPAISSTDTTNDSTTMAPQSIPQAPDSHPSMTQPNGGIPSQTSHDPERWRHMMEVSRIFQSHVNEMIAGVENEDDNAEDFGLGEIRRRPMGAWYD